MEPTPRRLALAILAGALALTACGDPGAKGRTGAEARPVNVVLIVIDTLRADAVFDPAHRYDTPCLDRLASDGVAFEHAFSAAPMTLPSHMSLFSSRPVPETGVLTNRQTVPADLPLLAEWLEEHGYDTRAVLSIGTLDPRDRTRSPGRGFESYDCDYWNLALAENTLPRLRDSLARRDARKPLFLFAHFSDPHEPYEAHGTETRRVVVTMDGRSLTELQAADMQQWKQTVELQAGSTVFELQPEREDARDLERLRGKPMRFMVRTFDCLEGGKHVPVRWEVGEQMDPVTGARVVVDRGDRPAGPCELRIWVSDVPARKEIRRRYALEVAYDDRYVGELVAELERTGLYRDSLIVFTSDHGEGLGEHGLFGHVENLSDALVHVPLIVKLPEGDARRPDLERAAGRMVSHIDVVPTLLEVAGLPPLPGQRGTSLFTPHEGVHVAQTSRPEAKRNQLAFRDERYKMTYFPDEERFELHDVVEDPGELLDVFAERKGARAAWPAQLRDCYRRSQERFAAGGAVDLVPDAALQALGYVGGE